MNSNFGKSMQMPLFMQGFDRQPSVLSKSSVCSSSQKKRDVRKTANGRTVIWEIR